MKTQAKANSHIAKGLCYLKDIFVPFPRLANQDMLMLILLRKPQLRRSRVMTTVTESLLHTRMSTENSP